MTEPIKRNNAVSFLAFTDIHGSYEKVNEIIRSEPRADGVIVGGDLTTYGSVADAEKALNLFRSNGKPIFAVAGNMDLPEFDRFYESASVSVNGRGMVFKDAGIFGVSGSPFTPMHTPYEIEEQEIARRAEQGWNHVATSRWKIFVPHAPPKDTKLDKILFGKHVGSTAVRAFIEQHQPDVVVCGHIHEARGTDTIGKTQIVNCGAAGKGYYAVIHLGERTTIEVRG
jgi:Icc-related predicted phosphoesterase